MGGFAWVTLATNDSYSLGALVLAHSLKEVGTAHQTAVLVTPGVTSAMRDKLTSVFNVVQEVNILDSRDEANLRLLKRPELGITFTKLHCWRLTQFEKCVFLDADTLVLQNSDELFEREELSAAPDVGWPDCFNSGVFVYRPSLNTYEKLIQFALERGSFDGGDQGLLNLFFADWAQKDISRHLPFIYNVCSTACYSYLPAFKQFGANAKIIHFIGAVKPWLQYFNTETKRVHPSGDASHLTEFLQRWWDIFCSFIHPVLSPAMAGLAGAFSQLTLGVARTPQQDAFENVLRKQAWEVGNIDYLGKDSFANIWSKISQTLAAASSGPQSTVTETAPVVPSAESQVASAPAESQTQSDVAATPVAPVPEAVQTKPEEPVLVCPLLPKETPVAAPVESPSVIENKTDTPVAVTAVPAEPVSPEVAPVAQSAAAETVIAKPPTAEIPKPSEPIPAAVPVTSAPSTPTTDVSKSAEPAPVAAPSPPTAEVPKPAEPVPAATPSTPTMDVPKSAEPAPVATPSTPTADFPKPAEPAPVAAPSSPIAEVPKPAEPVLAATPSTPTADVPKPAEPAPVPAPSSPIAEVPKPAEPVLAAAPSTPTVDVPKPAEPVPAVAPSTPTTDVPKAAESGPAATPSSPVAKATPTETAAASAVTMPTAEVAKSVETSVPGSKPKAERPKPSPAPTPEVKAAEPSSPKAEVVTKTLPATPGALPVAAVKTPQEVLKTPRSDVPATSHPSGEPSASAPKKTEKSKKSAPKPKK
ncbi:glycogenin-2-like isoform X2 [Euwallacea similis]|uniref:glycogenin-2-like isoform X2 n=1 Tax=Euwallacea similis TaxID=1736056 RepID=UPI00344EFC01